MDEPLERTCTSLAATAILLLSSCSSALRPESATLSCQDEYAAGSFIGLYSFQQGELPVPPAYPYQVDLAYYYDGDDCSQGAITGNDDRQGNLFPIGHRSWRDLLLLEPPAEGDDSVVAIAPVTEDKEGFAFWVKSGSGEYVLVRLRAVEQVSHADLVSGVTPRVEFEWLRPLPSTEED